MKERILLTLIDKLKHIKDNSFAVFEGPELVISVKIIRYGNEKNQMYVIHEISNMKESQLVKNDHRPNPSRLAGWLTGYLAI